MTPTEALTASVSALAGFNGMEQLSMHSALREALERRLNEHDDDDKVAMFTSALVRKD